MKKLTALLLALLLLILPSCSVAQDKYQTDFLDAFDTYTSLTGYASSEKVFLQYAESIHTEMLRLHKLYDIYNDYEGINNLKTVNDNAGVAPVIVDPAILDLLELAKQAYVDTSGTVNVALGPVLRIWHDYRTAGIANPDEAALPPMDELRRAAAFTDIDKLILDRENSSVFLVEREMSLDVGSIAKGYAAQMAVDKAKGEGFVSGTLNAGGNVCAVGHPLDGRKNWSVGVQSPEFTAEGAQELYDTIYINDCAAVSSGDYQRFYVVDGIPYHHIIDPETLLPAVQVRAVTVIHEDSTRADILSTASFILPYERAKELVERSGGQAMWIFADGSFRSTDGYAAISKRSGAEAG